MASTDDLRRDLAAAEEVVDETMRALARKHKGGEWARYRAAAAWHYYLERQLAKALGVKYAVRIEWVHPWDKGAPMPQVVSSGTNFLLLYLMADTDTDWDGTSISVVDPAGSATEELAIVRFERCLTYELYSPNSVWTLHPLRDKGLEPYAAHVVENSSLIAKHKTINNTPQPTSGASPNYEHYLLLFHDEIFECIATGYAIERFRGSFAAARSHCDKLLSEGEGVTTATQYNVARPIARPPGPVEPANRDESPVPLTGEYEPPSGFTLPLSWFMVLGLVAVVIFVVRGCG